MELSGHPGGLDAHKVASHPIDHWLEDCNVWECGDSAGEDSAAEAGDDHCRQDWGPTIHQDFPGVRVLLGSSDECGAECKVDGKDGQRSDD